MTRSPRLVAKAEASPLAAARRERWRREWWCNLGFALAVEVEGMLLKNGGVAATVNRKIERVVNVDPTKIRRAR